MNVNGESVLISKTCFLYIFIFNFNLNHCYVLTVIILTSSVVKKQVDSNLHFYVKEQWKCVNCCFIGRFR